MFLNQEVVHGAPPSTTFPAPVQGEQLVFSRKSGVSAKPRFEARGELVALAGHLRHTTDRKPVRNWVSQTSGRLAGGGIGSQPAASGGRRYRVGVGSGSG